MGFLRRVKRALAAFASDEELSRPTRQRRVAEHPGADRVVRPPHEPLEPQFFVRREP